MRKTMLCLLGLVAAVLATSVTLPAIGGGEPVHPDDNTTKMANTLAVEAGLDALSVELIFCVQRTFAAAVEQGWAVAIYDPKQNTTVAGLFNTKHEFEKISFRYQAADKTSKQVMATAAHHEGPFASHSAVTGPVMVTAVSLNSSGAYTIACLTGWDAANNRWAKSNIKDLKATDFD